MAPVLPPATVPPTVDLPETAPVLATHDDRRWTRHTVRPGETLFGISMRHGVDVATLVRRNDLGSRRMIMTGEVLEVPLRGAARATAARPASRSSSRPVTKTRAPGSVHLVRPGDTLSGIAAESGTTVARLAKLNGISPSDPLAVGRRLRVPGTAARSTNPRFDRDTFEGRDYPRAVVAAAERNRRALAGREVPSRDAVRAMIVRTARAHGVDPRLALAIGYQESGWDQRQVSVANAVGVMQVVPSTVEWTSQLAGRRLDPLETQDNITSGVVLLRVLTRSADTRAEAIAGYYQGLASVQQHGLYPDTRRYLRRVERLRRSM